MVRHGESPYNEGNERTRGLTPKGKIDIEKATKLLIGEGIDMIISSPFNKTRSSCRDQIYSLFCLTIVLR
jgi:2,3-bisphosphoglycerate-dependent phosphoglycerate mutase